MKKILPKADALVARIRRDFRYADGKNSWVVRIKSSGRFASSAFPEISSGEEVLLDFQPKEQWTRPSIALRWLTAFRLGYLPLTLWPILLAIIFSQTGRPTLLSVILLLTVFLIHISCNLWGDTEDHLRGLDQGPFEGGSGVIQNLWIPALHLRVAASILFLLGFLAGLGAIFLAAPSIAQWPWLLILGLVGASGAASYSGWPFHYKYFGLGEPMVFFLCGPFLATGSALLLGQFRILPLVWMSLPFSFLAVARLHTLNLAKIPTDTQAQSWTIARALGFYRARMLAYFTLASPYLCVAALAMQLGNWHLLLPVLATSLQALGLFQELKKCSGPLDPGMHRVRSSLQVWHWTFGALYLAGILGQLNVIN